MVIVFMFISITCGTIRNTTPYEQMDYENDVYINKTEFYNLCQSDTSLLNVENWINIVYYDGIDVKVEHVMYIKEIDKTISVIISPVNDSTYKISYLRK